ncbi:MAG: FxLYD domain-containing protein [Cyanobacteria bacterium P01_F01_bin.116]
MDRDRIIEAYIQRLLAWEKPVTPNTLAAISKEVGITPAEMHAIKRQAKAHFTRGRNYAEFGCLNDAVDEMTQATSLDPLNLEILHGLANAYNQRYNRESEPADRQRALMVARRCVELKPNDKEALVLISFLEHTSANTQAKLDQWTQQKITVLGGACAVLSLGLFGVSRLPIFSAPPAPLGPAPGTIIPGSAIYESTDRSEAEAAAAAAANPIEIDLTADVDIPVTFEHPGLILEARASELGDFEDEVYYQLRGVFINASDQEFRKLELDVEFLDRKGVEIATDSKTAIGAEDAILRPGDTHTFNLIQKITPELDKVNLSVTTIEQATARNTYVPPTPINYSWDIVQPDTFSFELASRSETFGANGQTVSLNSDTPKPPPASRVGFNSEWVIINTSDYPINELTLKAEFYDANERRLQSEEVVAIENNDAPLLPGEARPFRVIETVATGYTRYQVTVLKAE